VRGISPVGSGEGLLLTPPSNLNPLADENNNQAQLEAWKEVQSSKSAQLPTDNPASYAVTKALLYSSTGPASLSSIQDLAKLLDNLWCDTYLSPTKTFSERGVSPKHKDRKWEADATEFSEMMEILLDIQSRIWPEVK
jgi:hypothetical protein